MNNYTGNYVQFIHGGREFFETLAGLIDNAKESVHLQTYIIADDGTGTLIADALMRAAQNGVQVFVLADGYASQALPGSFTKKLTDAGVHFRFFEPIFTSRNFYFGRRLHHKVVVVDKQFSLVGGLNIADRYNDMPEERAWFDAALLVEGEISARLFNICTNLYENTGLKDPDRLRRSKDKIDFPKSKMLHQVRIRRNDWVKRRQDIRRTYSEFFRQAESSITIVCSYFLPGKLFRSQLRRALKRGVKIKVVLTGLSDIRTAKYAERFLYRWMLRNNIELYEYQPTVLHAKMAIVDKTKLTLGSYNINNISEFVSIELNLDVYSKEFVGKVQSEIDEVIEKDCKRILPSYKTNVFNQFLQWSSFQFVRVMLSVTTFYFRQEE